MKARILYFSLFNHQISINIKPNKFIDLQCEFYDSIKNSLPAKAQFYLEEAAKYVLYPNENEDISRMEALLNRFNMIGK